jgi:hypothetical protein
VAHNGLKRAQVSRGFQSQFGREGENCSTRALPRAPAGNQPGAARLNPTTRRIQRLLIGHATEIEVDANGRMLLSNPLRDYARLGKKVVLIGQGKKFELWDESLWNERMESWLGDAGDDEMPTVLAELTL